MMVQWSPLDCWVQRWDAAEHTWVGYIVGTRSVQASETNTGGKSSFTENLGFCSNLES